MRQRRPRRGTLDALGALLLALLLIAGPAEARTKKAALVDDDWDPVERSYYDDPGYEVFIEEALDIAGFEYEVFEIQTQGNPPQIPSVEELSAFPLVIWNCAAESHRALTFPEREVIRAYRELGGKLIVLGQGILNSIVLELQENPDNPELYEFLNDQLGVDDFSLDEYVQYLLPPTGGFPYIDFLQPVELDYSDLPEADPTQADIIYPTQDAFGLLTGQLPSGGSGPVSSDRYLPAPVHFQPVLAEAIADPVLRAQYLRAFSEWLGFEGDELLDFMHGLDLVGPIFECPPSAIGWSTGLNALTFEAWGDTACETVYGFDLGVGGAPCSWRVGFSHQLYVAYPGSEMVLLDLRDGWENSISVTTVAGQTPVDYILKLAVRVDGDLVAENYVDGLGAGNTYRTHVILDGANNELELRVMDIFGNVLGGLQLAGIRPQVAKLLIRSVGNGYPVEGPTRGWIDDLFLEGCLSPDGTDTGELPLPAPRLSAHPNPFNPSTRIRADLARAGEIRLSIHDVSGRELRVLATGWHAAGPLALDWDGRDAAGRRLGSGVYLLRLSGASGSGGTKLVLLK